MSFNTRKVDPKRIEYIDISDMINKDKTELPFVSDDEESGSHKEWTAEDDKTDETITAIDLKPEGNQTDLQHSNSLVMTMPRMDEPISPPKNSCMRLARNSYFS